jgi:hypothetical protein
MDEISLSLEAKEFIKDSPCVVSLAGGQAAQTM